MRQPDSQTVRQPNSQAISQPGKPLRAREKKQPAGVDPAKREFIKGGNLVSCQVHGLLFIKIFHPLTTGIACDLFRFFVH